MNKIINSIIKTWQEERSVRFVNVSLAVGLALLLFALSGFYIGFHNLDLSWNILRISYFENLTYDNYVDRYNAQGDIITYDTAYILGIQSMINSFYIMLLSGILISYSLSLYPLYVRNELKRRKIKKIKNDSNKTKRKY